MVKEKRLFVTAYMRYLPNMWLPIGNNAQVLDAMLCEMLALGQRTYSLTQITAPCGWPKRNGCL